MPGEPMVPHPLTVFIVSVEISLVVLGFDGWTETSLAVVWLAASLLLPSRTRTRLTGVFSRVLLLAVLFLVLIHAVEISPLGISYNGLVEAVRAFVRIAVVFAVVLVCVKLISSDKLYAVCVDLHVPPVAILVLFRTLWLVPRLMERADEVILAQKLRGMRMRNRLDGLRALVPTLIPMIGSLIEETSSHSLAITMRGFLLRGEKTHFARLEFKPAEILLIAVATVWTVLSWF